MRATMSGYYRNLNYDQNKVVKELFDVTKQISSGVKIQYAYEDVSTFVDTVRLDNEITTLTQVKQNAQKALQVSTNTDSTMNDMTKILDAMKVKMVSAANESHSPESLAAIATELRGLESNLIALANTSIDGNYLFSGSQVNTKPIDNNGLYQGNDGDIKAFIGSGVEQKYNISGTDLFLGEESNIQRKVSLNIAQFNQTELFPDIMTDPNLSRTSSKEEYLTSSNTIRDMMGDSDNIIDTATSKHFFYLRGTQSDGSSFKEKFSMRDDETVDDLLNRIGQAFGNSVQGDIVDVIMNTDGQIEIQDKLKGSSKLDFHMVAATDLAGGGSADVTVIDALDDGQTDLRLILDNLTTAGNPDLYVKSFMESGLTASGTATNIEAIKYDRVNFENDGAKLLGNVSQIVVDDNTYANASTKLIDVASTMTGGIPPLRMEGIDLNGDNFIVDFNFSSPVTYGLSLNGGPVSTFNIFNADSTRTATAPDEVTYQQLLDVVNMTITGTARTGNTDADYDADILTSYNLGRTSLSFDGKIEFEELNATSTSAQFSIADGSAGNFISTVDGSYMTFNTNNTLEISDAKTNFFQQIDEAIKSVELGRIRADGSLRDPRNGGVQNGIQAIDDLSIHLFTQHSAAGVQSQTLQTTEDRTDLLIITTKTLRSETLDIDIAEASLSLQQLTLNYQAMLSTVSRVTQLSLVNYL